MCGISGSYGYPTYNNKRHINRGPDHQQNICFKNGKLILSAFVLHVQGEKIYHQPCSIESKHLIYNGQLIKHSEERGSDTEFLVSSIAKYGVLKTVERFCGPCAAICYDENDDCLWFWRDYFGRRSLLITIHCSGFILSSVADREYGDWVEVPSSGVFCYKFTNSKLFCYPYDTLALQEQCKKFASRFPESTILSGPLSTPVSSLNKCPVLETPLNWTETTHRFVELLSRAVHYREQCCTKQITLSDGIFSDYTSRHCYCDNGVDCSVHSGVFRGSGARVGVLFSGGIDCTVLAFLLDRSVPKAEPIDLLNVSFGDYDTTPDRLSALSSLQDLQSTCPNRTWNLIKVNVTRTELQAARARYITDLIYPHSSVLDDSIGCALWFAARGVGHGDDDVTIFSTARLLFSGIGADELLGGYSRHRGAWNRGGIEAVIQEIELDINRISDRNLGRDNRVVGDHGRDCVAPYLDEEFVSFVNSLPVQYKVDFTLPRGEGEKLILRKIARNMGLTTSSSLPKKAIQFGSKIAKLEKRKEKGSDICSRLA